MRNGSPRNRFAAKVRVLLAGGVLALSLHAGSARAAEVLLNTFGPGNTYSTINGFVISQGLSAFGLYYGHQFIAVPFTPSINASLETLQFGLSTYYGPGSMVVEVRADSGGLPNGSLLESFSTSFVDGVLTLSSVSHPEFAAGSGYWVTMRPGTADTLGIWFANNQGFSGMVAHNAGANWSQTLGVTLPALRVEALAVPEPGVWTLCMAGLGILAASRRSRRAS